MSKKIDKEGIELVKERIRIRRPPIRYLVIAGIEETAKAIFEELRRKGKIKKIQINTGSGWCTMFQLSISPKELIEWERGWGVE